jgi:ubiquitin-protein ligase
MDQDPHLRRLTLEYEKLINLASRSDFIKIDPVEAKPGMPPDKYVITFTCKGIARINENKEPVAATTHRVSMFISREFPRKEPYLKWLTPIWHPNIEHKEPHHVCTNEPQNFFSTKGLDDFVLVLGEMVQYKRYHAVWKQPWPLDKEVADWVVEYAEPHHIVGPDKAFDDQHLLREYKIRGGGGSKPSPSPAEKRPKPPTKREGLTLGAKRSSAAPSPVRKPGITLGGTKRNT